MRPTKLTTDQLRKLHEVEPLLQQAARIGDYESAQRYAFELQSTLRPTGHETRLMHSKLWLFEAAIGKGDLNFAVQGLMGIRGKAAKNTRLHLEATALLAICSLRQRNLREAAPLIAEVLRSKKIRSERSRRQFLRGLVARFEEEGLLAALGARQPEQLDPVEIQELAAGLVKSKNEDEIFAEMGHAVPRESVDFLLKVDKLAKSALTSKEALYLPGEALLVEKAQLGRTLFASIKRVLWNSLCDPQSDIYKAWFGGLSVFL